jgi:acyl-CoA dehydrogenase
MKLSFGPEELAFRDEVRAFLREKLSPEMSRATHLTTSVFSEPDVGREWNRILHRKGWAAPGWPVEYGGTGFSLVQRWIFGTEFARAGAPSLSPMGLKMAGPVIMKFGTPEQKAHYLPRILAGDDYWCQGYSEPGSGSDLASLKTRAVRDGDHYVVNGTKIWTTHAHHANMMFALVRTGGEDVPKHKGISFLLIDMKTPGITIRPIRTIGGDHEVNQVFFDDVRVPLSSLVGKENDGWTVAKYLLQHERGGAWAPRLRARLRRLRRAADAAFSGLPGDSLERIDMNLKLADAECRIDAMQAMEMEALAAQSRGEPPGGIGPSMNKILGTEMKQRITELGIEISGRYALARVPMPECALHDLGMSEEPVFNMSAYLNDRAASIYAGSNEVQRNIIAQQLLSGR